MESLASSDEDIIRGIASGDRRSLADLYDRYSPSLLAQAQRILRSHGEAEDLVHDVYLEVWRAAHTYDARRGSVRAWLMIRVRSRALDALKRAHNARRSSQDVNDVLELTAGEPDDALGVDGEAVRRALAALPSEQRAVLEHFYFDGMQLSEIAELLNVPVGTIKSRASRAIAKIKAELAGSL